MPSTYHPQKEYRIVLARAWAHVQSVPYRVSLRWLFYRLLQEGCFTKEDYKRFKDGPMSRARKEFYEEWKPYTLADDTREMLLRGHGSHSPQGWLDSLTDPDNGLRCTLHRWQGQEWYVMLWFEAKAMTSQFSYYAEHFTLAPLGGSPSIPFKWQISQHIAQAARAYNLPVLVLYYGDYDPKGRSIPKETLPDVRDWCEVEFEYVRVGLSLEDAARFNLPENFKKPGQYQWEALTDAQARELIEGSIQQYVDVDRMAQVDELEAKATRQVRAYLAKLTLEENNR